MAFFIAEGNHVQVALAENRNGLCLNGRSCPHSLNNANIIRHSMVRMDGLNFLLLIVLDAWGISLLMSATGVEHVWTYANKIIDAERPSDNRSFLQNNFVHTVYWSITAIHYHWLEKTQTNQWMWIYSLQNIKKRKHIICFARCCLSGTRPDE